MQEKPVLSSLEFKRILDFGHRRFMDSKQLPKDRAETQVYLILFGLKDLMDSMKIELPFDLEDLSKEKLDCGGLDDIG